MRRIVGLIMLVGLTAGVTWGVASAADSTVVTTLCVRPGADVRAPSTSGSCPSGYTKTDVVVPPLPTAPAPVAVVPDHESQTCSATGTFLFCDVDCPEGKVATGGGATSDGNGTDAHLIRSDPRLVDGVATGWLMSLGAPTSRNLVVTVHVLCV